LPLGLRASAGELRRLARGQLFDELRGKITARGAAIERAIALAVQGHVSAKESTGIDHALNAALDELYAAPFDTFVSLRRELSTRLRGSGNAAGARLVAQAAKPTRTAWALNQVARAHPDIIAAIVRLRAAAATEQKTGDAQTIRDGVRRYRDAVGVAVRAVRSTLAADGVALSSTQARRLSETVQALSTDEIEREKLASGRLTRDVEVEDLFAGIEVSEVARHPKRRAPAHDVKGSKVDAEAARGREAERLRVERERQERERAVEEARAHVASLERAVDEARKISMEAEREARRAQYDSDKAARALAELERKLERARDDLMKPQH